MSSSYAIQEPALAQCPLSSSSHIVLTAEYIFGPISDIRLVRESTNRPGDALAENDRDQLLNQLSALIPRLESSQSQDPSLLTNLVEALIRPESYTFSRALSIKPPVDLTAGLAIGATPINHVILKLLRKASQNASDTGILAGQPELICALVSLWLGTPDIKVADEALRVLESMLNARFRASGQGQGAVTENPYRPSSASAVLGDSLMWRRLVNDKDVYGLFFSYCGWRRSDPAPSTLEKRAKTEAQGRLLNFLLLYADHPLIQSSQIADIEQDYGVDHGGGLLEFGACNMVDRDDTLMEANLIRWYQLFIAGKVPEGFSLFKIHFHNLSPLHPLSNRLAFLRKHKIHGRLIDGYLHHSTSPAWCSGYVMSFASRHPVSFLNDHSLVSDVRSHLISYFKSLTASQWANGTIDVYEIGMLTHLAPLALLPTSNTTSPLFFIPINPPTGYAISTLAAIFSNSFSKNTAIELSASAAQVSSLANQNSAAARVLYYLYFSSNPALWVSVTRAAQNYEMFQDEARAAFQLIHALIDAVWAPLPTEATVSEFHPDYRLPTEATLRSKSPRAAIPRGAGPRSGTLPSTGLLALLSPPAYEPLWEYLSTPAFSGHLRGAGSEASENAYEVGRAKEAVLIKLSERVNEALGGGRLDEAETRTLMTVQGNLEQLKRRGRSVGVGEIGTLEL